MIRVSIRVDGSGLLRRVDVSGHAAFEVAGKDIVCASVTALVRSAVRVLEIDSRFAIQGNTEAPGQLFFSVGSVDPAGDEYLRGVSSFLILGLGDIASEFPDRCMIEVK